MHRVPALGRKLFLWSKKIALFGVILFALFLVTQQLTSVVFAQTPTVVPPGTTAATWEFDPIVTQVGKNADRARQLLWWVFQHPGIHTAPVLAQVWAVSRNIVMAFLVLVIVALGLSLILGKRRGVLGPIFSGISSPLFGVNIPFIFIKVGSLVIYVVFSYIMIVALVQTSDILMKFFIETVGGKDLFNIIFAGSGNTEANYITFVGYKDINPLSEEMINTSLTMIRLTSMTYNAMTTILVLRTIILWFLIIISPFLALLAPFVFIRNIGWIWIGVFFQWLFYGPLFALFLATLTRIWVAGIPYSFDFSRINKPTGQVYRTAINILWGGPAQTLSPGNSANYVDTYAEYVIALIMLWAAIILPWLLLRIFRDYCCSMIAAGSNTLNSIFDRLRQYPPPPSTQPVGPATTSGMAVELPFRQHIEEKVREVQKVTIEEIKDVSRVSTSDLARAMDLSVSRLSDVSRFETSDIARSQYASYMDRLKTPERITSLQDREKYREVRDELVSRSQKGDRVAQTILNASENNTRMMADQITMMGRLKPVAVPVSVAVSAKIETESAQIIPAQTSAQIVNDVSRITGISDFVTREVLSKVSTEEINHAEKLVSVAKEISISSEKVRQIMETAQNIRSQIISENRESISEISRRSGITTDQVIQILSNISYEDINHEEKVTRAAKKINVSNDKVKEVLTLAHEFEKAKKIKVSDEVIKNIAKEQSLAEEKIKEVLSEITHEEVEDAQKVKKVSEKTGVPEGKVKEIAKSQAPPPISPQVSLEDYEEVKTMWLKHYRSAPVPVSQTVKDRWAWLINEERKLVNIQNLLASPNLVLKQQGLEKVAEILPFMLLGGFSEGEIATYVRAKLEANKQVLREFEVEAKAREEVRKQLKDEDEEILVERAADKKEEKKKEMRKENELTAENKEDKKEEKDEKIVN